MRRATFLTAVLLLSALPTVGSAEAPDACPRPASPPVTRISGPDRVATAAAAVTATDGDVDEVVVVGSSSYADAAVGAVLAANLDAALFLTDRAALSPVVRDALGRLDREGDGGVAFVVGGGAVVSSAVDRELRQLGFPVRRVHGPDRYATAADAASLTHPDGTGPATVASGGSWSDLVAAAAHAAATGGRLLLTPPEDATSVAGAVTDAEVTVVGAPDAVTDRAYAQLEETAAAVRRIHGPTPQATAARVAGTLHDADAFVATAADWPDAVVAAASAAREHSAVLLVGDALDSTTAATIPGRGVTVIGGTTAVPAHLAGDLADAAGGTRGAPHTRLGPADCSTMATMVDRTTVLRVVLDRGTWTDVDVSADGLGAAVHVHGATLRLELTPGDDGRRTVALEATAVDGDAHRRVARGWTIEVRPDAVRSPEGWLVAGGSGAVAGGHGPLYRYTVEVADGLEARQGLTRFARFVEATLSHPAHGWTARGAHRLQRVSDTRAADVRVLLAAPAHVDRQCRKAGLDTAGTYSCWNGRFAALNSDRWFHGVAHVPDLTLYRTYLVNHEVGHGLGRGHRTCPAEGALSPVMMQLTKSTYGCRPNGWPYP